MKYLLCLLTLLVMACANEENYDKKIVHMRILSVDPPKRVYVDLANVETGEIWNHIRVSKRCHNWRLIPIGGVIDMTEYSYSQGSRKYRELKGREIYDKFCTN